MRRPPPSGIVMLGREKRIGFFAVERLVEDDGAGFGDVGVEFVDEVSVLLFDYTALEFHGEGETAAVEGEIVGEEGEALDGFVLGEVGGQARDFFLDQSVRGGIGGQLGVGRKFQAVLGELGGDSDRVGNDEGDDKFALITDNHGVQDIRAGFQGIFDGLRGDEFAGGGFEEILFAVGDEEVIVFVEIANVAGFKPAVVGKNFAGGFRRFEISLHDARTLGDNFAIVGDVQLNVGDWAAGTPGAVMRMVAGEDGRGFRQAVALIDGNADGPEKLAEVFGERSAAGKNGAELAAGAGANFGVDERVGNDPLQTNGQAGGFLATTPGGGFAGCLHGELEDFALGAGGFASLLHQAGVDFFEEAGNGGEDGGLDFEQSLGNIFDDVDIGDRAAVKNINVIEHPAIHVGEREKRDGEIGAGAEIEFVAGVGDIGAEIGVGEHDALGLTGCTGGIDERGQLAGENLGGAEAVGRDFRGAGGGDQRFVAEEVGGEIVAGACDDHLLNLFQGVADREEFLQLFGASDEEDLGATVVEDVGHAVGGFVEVNGNGDAAGAADGEIGGVPFGAVGGKEADAVAGFHAEFDKGVGEPRYAAEEFLGGDGFPAVGAAEHLGAGRGVLFDGVEEAGGKGAVGHGKVEFT